MDNVFWGYFVVIGSKQPTSKSNIHNKLNFVYSTNKYDDYIIARNKYFRKYHQN